jgi:hypothetical protein
MMSWKAGKLKTSTGWRVQGACFGEGPVEIIAVMIFLWGEMMETKKSCFRKSRSPYQFLIIIDTH